MSSPADRFTRLQKVGIFLIVLGEEKARRILAGLDLETLERINAAIAGLGEVTPQEKAAVLIEFGDFFYKNTPLSSKLQPPPSGGKTSGKGRGSSAAPPSGSGGASPPAPPSEAEEESSVRRALRHLRRRVDPGQIDWGRAGYDFGEGFRGPERGTR